MGTSSITDAADLEDDEEVVEYPEFVTAASLIARPPKAIEWLIDGFIPQGKVGILAAQGGTGKSMFALQLGVSIATDLPAFDDMWEVGTNSSGAVLYLAGEEAEEDLRRRLWPIQQRLSDETTDNQSSNVLSLPSRKLAHRLKKFKLLPMVGLHTPFLNDDEETAFYSYILATAMETENLKLIIIDPLRRFHDGEENDSGATTRIMCMCEKLAESTGATVLVIHHVPKSSGKQDTWNQNVARGSSAITDSARFQINLKTLDEKELKKIGIFNDERGRYLSVALTKSNYSPPQSKLLYLKRDEGGYLSQYRPDCFGCDNESLEESILRLVAASEENGQRFGKTAFKEKYAGKQLNAGQKAIADAIDFLVGEGRLFYVRDNKSEGAGRRADLLSTTQHSPSSPTRRRRSKVVN